MNPHPNASSSTFEERWEILKPIIEHLYLNERKNVAEIARIMKDDHGFDAVVHQYRHRFKKWQWKKNVRKSKMTDMANQLESRAMVGKSGTVIHYKGREVDSQKMRRFMKESRRKIEQQMVFSHRPIHGSSSLGLVLPFANSVFLKWNLPYEALRRLQVRPVDHSSPAAFSVPTPGSDISVVTPSAATPHNAPSPTTVALKRKNATDRAHLFVQGQHDSLLISMNVEERRLMSDWLYQYWFFCYKTAKHWGKGPYNWTAELLQFTHHQSGSARSLPGTPRNAILQSGDHSNQELMPTDHCRWFIHVKESSYDPIEEHQLYENRPEQDPNDESTWLPWPQHQEQPDLPTRLQDALEHNDFSAIPAGDLPVSIPQIAKAAQRSPDELLLESLGFSIMSRNRDQVRAIMKELDSKNIIIVSFFPLHMAGSYLDGSGTCCGIFYELLVGRPWPRLQETFVNELGHTFLDNLMISILKSHSSATPAVFDSAWKDNTRFVGEEVDICGRWDADSPCLRELFANGKPSIPSSWKHKFCHTSAQTICHCITIMGDWIPTRLMEESGLFMRHCFECGTKLQLHALHSLVMTGYYLITEGCADEDLFGILACLLCLISVGISPNTTAEVSVSALIETGGIEVMCDHERMTPGQLASSILKLPLVGSWSTKARTGWAVICGVLNRIENTADDPESEDEDESVQDYHARIRHHHMVESNQSNDDLYDDHMDHHSSGFKSSRDVGTLWASVQAELLTYRRLDRKMSWTSQYISMKDLKSQLDHNEPFSTKYDKLGLLKTHCICGMFVEGLIPTLSEATDPDIANLDVWNRATYGGQDS